ncbi:MAG TPA: hypothetical protein PLJ71_13410 [Candidatus Hydrogenedentes bacterium]|nr:hypothetical protein [Candidatus Hydrogenedentota bacterium]
MLELVLSTLFLNAVELPMGAAPEPVPLLHFPDRLHAYVWRNWTLVPVDRMATAIGAKPGELLAVGAVMGLSEPPSITEDQWRRSYITVLRRNWQLLPYDQLLELLGWTPEQMDYVLREGDGLFWWFGQYKPRLDPLRYAPPTEAATARAADIARITRETFPQGLHTAEEPLFAFVKELTQTPPPETATQPDSLFSPRFCFSYFGAFRDPFAEGADPYPEGYLARLAATGVDGVWLHEPLYKLATFPWDPSLSEGREQRLDALRNLVERARRHGIGIYLYLNEPRPMPIAFFEKHPELRGVTDMQVQPGQVATLCTSIPAVQAYLRDSVASLCREAPGLAGLFTITASENFTNCWSHHNAGECPRCSARSPEEVIAESNTLIAEGIAQAGASCQLLVWDWGWRNEWAEGIIRRLPKQAAFMSVSEWDMPIARGGVETLIGEYSLSVIGPGPRASRHWAIARECGLKTLAKIQAGTSWELGSVPYVPAVENIVRHAANLREDPPGVDGLMMSWTLGGYPSPNLEAVIEVGRPGKPTVDEALLSVATRRFGPQAAPIVVRAWKGFSAAFTEYPFCGSVLYSSPVHLGPANLLWEKPTGYRAPMTMGFGCPFDDLDTWRGPYPAPVFAAQFNKVAEGFEQSLRTLQSAPMSPPLEDEIGIAEACAINFRSIANQVNFVLLRNELAALAASPPPAGSVKKANGVLDQLDAILRDELALAVRLRALQARDSRIGFEAACQYFYVSADLGEKILNCQDLLSRWLPEQQERFREKP